MIRKVIISTKAQNSLAEIAGYIENKFSVNARILFMKKFRDSVLSASENPEIFPLVLNKKIHKCVVTKQTSFFYKFNSTKLEIISIFDTRQNPNKIKKDIK